jgi:hypothetical protein
MIRLAHPRRIPQAARRPAEYKCRLPPSRSTTLLPPDLFDPV